MNFNPESQQPIVVIQLTDSHLFADPADRLLNVRTESSLGSVLRHVVQHQPDIDLLLATGDITQDGSLVAHQRFLQMAASVPAPVRGLPGNHDSGEAFRQAWGEHAEPVMDIGSWRVIMLDTRIPGSDAGRLADDQLDLLRMAVRQAGDRHVLLALHHNPVPMSSQWLDTMMIANAEQLFGLLRGLPQVKAVIWGHVHQEYDNVHDFAAALANRPSAGTRQTPHVLRLLAAPSTCVQFAVNSQKFSLDDADPGYRRLTLYPDGRLETAVFRVEGLNLKPEANSTGY